MLCQSWGAIKSSPEVGKFLQTSGIVIEDPDALGGFELSVHKMRNCWAADNVYTNAPAPGSVPIPIHVYIY